MSGLNLTFRKIADECGVKSENFTNLAHVPCPKYEGLLANYIGFDAWMLWPHRYSEDFKPNRISLKYHKLEFYKHRNRKRTEIHEKDDQSS